MKPPIWQACSDPDFSYEPDPRRSLPRLTWGCRMRCLFVVDQIARFREVAMALDSHGIAMTLVKGFKYKRRGEKKL
jgi:hypothetical protein